MAGRGVQRPPVGVVIGMDGSGRSHRLAQLAAASDLTVELIGPGASVEDVEKLADGCLVLVDDPHRLEADVLAELARAARAGQPMVMARRPSIGNRETADLDEVLALSGVEMLAPLDAEQVGRLLATATGTPPTTEDLRRVRTASAGLPVIALALAPGHEGSLGARVQRRLATMPAAPAQLAQVLALRLQLDDRALARACGLDLDGLDGARAAIRDEGLLGPGTEELVPAVADTLLADLPAGRRRRLHAAVAAALLATGAPVQFAAEQLRAARAGGPEAAEAYARAGELLRFTDPQAALGWFDDARDNGAPEADLIAGRAEAAALLGIPDGSVEEYALDDPVRTRLALVAGAVAAHDGRAGRAAEALIRAGPRGAALAVPALVAIGDLAQARSVEARSIQAHIVQAHIVQAHIVEAHGVGAQSSGTETRASSVDQAGATVVRFLAGTALAATDPQDALPRAIEAAEAMERGAPEVVLPDTPHAIGAVLAVATGDSAVAVDLLERALAAGAGGPAAQPRHRLLLAWTLLRRGRPEAARERLTGISSTGLGGRDLTTLACVRAGLARRAGDVTSLRQVWPDVERVIARRSLDLFALEAAEELAVAATRLRRGTTFAATLDDLDAIVHGLGDPPAWVIALGWLRLQVAVAADDATAARDAADRMAAVVAAGRRSLACQVAGRIWADALRGDVRPDDVAAAAAALAEVEMPYEASRLAGDAAIRVTSATAARRLLELARELTAPVPATSASSGDPAQLAGLSEREVEVAELVLAGRTHREIGAQLYIAPKTVEHHVARIRTKLGATGRAEFFAALNTLFEEAGRAAP